MTAVIRPGMFEFGRRPGPERTRTGIPATPTIAPLTTEEQSAKAMLDSSLGEFGLGGLGGWAWEQFKRGVPVEQIFLDLRERPEYRARFPGMEALTKRGRAISEREYIELERSYTQIARAAGLPSGFYDQPDDFARLVQNEVSPQEFSTRVEMAAVSAYQSPPELRDELSRLYGMGPGELTAYWLDPDRALPLLQQQFLAGQIGSRARTTGFGTLTRDEAERLAQQGVTEQRAQEGFGRLAESGELFRALPGTGEDEITREEQLGATFTGNANALERVRRRQARRRGEFQGGGSYATSREGIGGLGPAR